MTVEELEKKAVFIRLLALTAIQKAGTANTGLSMSIVEILTVLYYGTLNRESVVKVSAKNPKWEEQDYVLLAKSDAAIVQYSILADLGFFDREELDYFGLINSLLQGRLLPRIPGVVAPSISPGTALSEAFGIALSLKAERKQNRVYSVLDISELQCGQVWEAAMAAAHYKLNNLIVFIDDCGFQVDGNVRSVMDTGSVQAKFDGFGWQVIRVHNGNDFDQLLDSLLRSFTVNRKPVCIWANTVSGKGIDFAERKHGYFSAPFSAQELELVNLKLKALL